MSSIKQQLYNLCLAYVQSRMQAAQEAIDQAQQSSTDDTKSSAGDKYETGREMAQQETNRNMAQLTEANKLLVALNRINPEHVTSRAEAGSLVLTSGGNFYLSISAGNLVVDGKNYFAVSPVSPIGLKMSGKLAGEEFSLNGKTYQIVSVS